MLNKSRLPEPFEQKVWLSSPTMHGEELRWVEEAYRTNWMSTVGENIDEAEKFSAAACGRARGVALSSGTAALHLAVKLAGVGPGDEVLCSDVTFAATVNPIAYEGGVPVFVDTERATWNMDPEALERAFELHPHAKAVMVAHLYGTPARMDEIVSIAHAHGAAVIEDAAEALGASYRGRPAGSLGDISVISFNGNKIITGSSGGALLTDDPDVAAKARKLSTQAREAAPWYQHEELGYNYRMSNVVAGVVRGQFPHLAEHVAQKRAIYERYKEGFEGLPVSMNPYDAEGSESNFWLSCLIVDEGAMCPQVRGERDYLYTPQPGKSCPQEVLDAISALNAEGRPIWKPMHMQPVYRNSAFVTREGNGRARTNAYLPGGVEDVGMDVFQRGLCLPSDNKMTPAQQDRIIAAVRACFE